MKNRWLITLCFHEIGETPDEDKIYHEEVKCLDENEIQDTIMKAKSFGYAELISFNGRQI